MGEVYRARDSKLNREVAIKVLPEQFVRDPERIASRFCLRAGTRSAYVREAWLPRARMTTS